MPRTSTPQLSRQSIEHLLFCLHPKVFDAIESELLKIERLQPGFLNGATSLARFSNAMGSQERFKAQDLGPLPLPAYDLHVVIRHDDSIPIRKVRDATIRAVAHRRPNSGRYPGCHLVLTVIGGPIRQGYILPLGYALTTLNDITLQDDRFQIYQHRLYPDTYPILAPTRNGTAAVLPWSSFADTGFVYTGLTGRNWATRLREHRRAAFSGSNTLFHKALRGDLFPIAATEYEVVRVGLTRDEAMRMEEIEVEAKSLFPIHQNGLNMIPGGEAGLRFISQFRGPNAAVPKPGHTEEAYAAGIERLIDDTSHDGSALRKLWAENLEFRIKATTNRADRLSRLQITCARIWAAAQWSLGKIVEKLMGIDGRRASLGQVKRVLKGQTYRDIPNVEPKMQRPRNNSDDTDLT